MTIFFTSDLHFDHQNILKYCPRPYKYVEEMNEGIIKEYNSVVTDNDTVYLLGDISFSKDKERTKAFVKRLNGDKRLIRGNHDDPYSMRSIFAHVYEYLEFSHNKNFYCLFHYPIHEWNRMHHGSIMLHGHQHHNGVRENKGIRRFDVGVDAWNMKPVSIEQIEELAAKLPKKNPRYGHEEK